MHGGLAVAMPFIHTRPRYFAQIIGELLYWIGEDRIQFSSDYAIWTPKWLVERFVDFQIPEDMTRVRPAHDGAEEEDPRPQRRQDVRPRRCPAELRLPDADEPATGPRGADDTAERAGPERLAGV